ncbi:glycoside hydrolase family 25 protein [Butyrivibrio sp. VCB2006]|uniref:glycoside hydrolase family 25 protein n=1 Tax=Butyrivibrio sp. VCB2006 TaxID=1280679 RepID=UPI000400D09C|nr:glycoside hydrolase family 25 protein [Butyrivibrio sp. VCB2006]
MLKKTQIALITVILALLVIIPVGLLVSGMSDDFEDQAEAEQSSIFQSVSNLEALDLGLIDGNELREENGIDASSGNSSLQVEAEDITVSISLRSIQDDLKIKLSNSATDKLISNVNFTVTVKGKNKTVDYSDSDMDGIIYIPYVEAGDYTVFLSDISADNKNYHADKSQTITVSDSIKYTKVDIKDEIKEESQINVAAEDTKVQDADQTTDISGASDVTGSQDSSATAATPELHEDDISEDAEDLLAQIEAETAASEASKAGYKGAEGGTITAHTPSEAPAIASDPQYIAAHSGTKGIDVSKHNGNINWSAVKNDGINFAIIRCGYRGSSSGALVIDPLYYTNMAGAQSNGINTGVYFFTQAVNEAEAVEEASMVLELLSGYSLQMPVYLDVEASHGRGDQISSEERTAVCHAFLTTIRNAGYTAGIYSNKKWFEEGRLNTASFTDYKIWLAQYVDIPTYSATRYDMWQYTSKGQVNGIGGYVDMNVLR